jgi:DNA helicase II / ATP-dependent DNA helicase PcrA
MKFIADFHVHSKFSRATAKNLDLENLYIAAQQKGVTVVGTGDFTHPGWYSELQAKLLPAEPGLYKLTAEIERSCDEAVPNSCRRPVRFILTTEISNIYKKNGKTRKNHNLVMVPNFNIAEKLNLKLAKIGNIQSDGRPILGLDARDLLEMVLEVSDQGILIPAHIWTPWFSVLGSKSGFDSIEECFRDLTAKIIAVETGLSSDPPMNWRVSGLDGLTLVSNSDAHSPMNLGREANIFNTSLSYADIRSAIKSGDPETFLGTFEFFPEEGKYHLDGHRNCSIRLRPQDTRDYHGQCPVCGKSLTLGVLYRVDELADRGPNPPPGFHPYHSVIPLADILAEILRTGSNSKKVKQTYQTTISRLGSEFDILHLLEPEAIDRGGVPLLSEAIRRMRQKEITVTPGYDGEYGQVHIFSASERERLMGQQLLFSLPTAPTRSDGDPPSEGLPASPLPEVRVNISKASIPDSNSDSEPICMVSGLNQDQRRAVEHPSGPLLIIAGPGTGKTRTLTHRIAYLIIKKGVPPDHVLAVTFTNKAAQEMRARLRAIVGNNQPLPLVGTFHSVCLRILKGQNDRPIGLVDEVHQNALIAEAVRQVQATGVSVALKVHSISQQIMTAKQQILSPDEFVKIYANTPENILIAKIYRVYQELLTIQGLCDYEDLIFKVVRLLENDQNQCNRYRQQFQHIFVDEYQDLNQAQYRLLRALAPDRTSVRDLCVIGDPDQSIYGFRGSDVKYFERFISDYPKTAVIHLARNYRSTRAILEASFQMIKDHRSQSSDIRTYAQRDGIQSISILELANGKAEAESIAREIEQQIGGTGYHSIDTGQVTDTYLSRSRTYADFAVLYRTHEQHRIITEVFDQRGIPYQIASREHVLDQAGLSEIISFLKLIEGYGGFWDNEKVILAAMPTFGKKAADQFKDWCFRNQFSLSEGWLKAARFPIPGMPSTKQQMLNGFSNQIRAHKKEMSTMTVAEKLSYLQKNTAIEKLFKGNIKLEEAAAGLIAFAGQFNCSTADFFAAAALLADTDAHTPMVEKVSLMTLHAAKGLEFAVVFIAGCEEKLIPYQRPNSEPADIREERRLFYVAMTRAMEKLYLTRAKMRRIFGKPQKRMISSFVASIEDRLIKHESHGINLKKKRKQARQLTLFSILM